ncbi:hypothetical protein H4S02_005500, partial [Coemansia sp. RSA 2611]
MQYQYVVSAHKPSSVLASVSGAFTMPQATDLIVAKGNRLEVHTLAAGTDKLQLVGSWALNGRIASVDFMHPADRLTGLVLVTSDKFQFAVLSWDATEQRLATESTGEFGEATGRPTTEAKLVAVDPLGRVAAVYAYQGIVHLLPMVSAQEPQSPWRTLLRATGSRRQRGIGSTGDGAAWPYAVHEPVAGGSARAKGKAAAYAERSSDIYAILTRYIHELKVLDLQFMHAGADELPAFAVLYEDANMQRQVRVYRLGESRGELQPVAAWASLSLEATAARLVPLPGNSVLVAGDEALAVVSAERPALAMSKRAAAPTAWAWIDADAHTRLLLADDAGGLSLVVLQRVEGAVQDLFVEHLGSTAVATSLAYLGGGCVYVGSHCGDQMLARLHTQPLAPDARAAMNRRALHALDGSDGSDSVLACPLGDTDSSARQAPPNSFVELLELHENLAPLVDLSVVGSGDGRRGSYGGVVSCSGMRTTPSLRAVRNGIGLEQLAGVDVAGLLGLWSLTVAQGAPSDSAAMDVDSRLVLLVLSLIDRTLLLGWAESGTAQLDVGELALAGWRLDEPTLAAGLAGDGRHVVQVTSRAVVLIDSGAWAVRAAWTPADVGLAAISAAAVAGSQVAVAVDGCTVAYLEVREGTLACVARRELPSAVACIDVHAWQGAASHVAVGLWAANDVCLLALPNLAPACSALSLCMPQGALPAEPAAAAAAESAAPSLPRSVLMCTLGGTPYLLVGLGDGRLHHFALADEGGSMRVREHRAIALGSGPLGLTPFANGGELNVFAAGDHSAVLFAGAGGKLMYANVDELGITRMAPVAAAGLPAAMCLASERRLWLAQADPVQRLHVRSHALPPWAAPHRIAHSPAGAVYGVATIHSLDAGGSLTSTASDVAVWQRLALMDAAEPQANLLGDARAALAVCSPAEVARFSLLDCQTMDVLASVLLRPFEMPESLCVASLACLERPPPEAATASAGGAPEPAAAASRSSHNGGDPASAAPAALENAFVLGTSIVLPGEDDARRGRIIACTYDAVQQQMRIVGSFATVGAVYALVPFRGMLLAAVNARLLLLGWQRRAVGAGPAGAVRRVCDGVVCAEDPEFELVVLCSQQTQIAALSVSVSGDYVAVGDIMSSVSLFRYEELVVPSASRVNASLADSEPALEPPASQLRRRLVPVS